MTPEELRLYLAVREAAPVMEVAVNPQPLGKYLYSPTPLKQQPREKPCLPTFWHMAGALRCGIDTQIN